MIEYEDTFDQKAVLNIEDMGDYFSLTVFDEFDSATIRLTQDDLWYLMVDVKEMLT